AHVVEPQHDPALAAEEDDGEHLGEADFQEDDAVQEMHDRYRMSAFTPVGSDVDISSPYTSLSGSFANLVIH
ncbi:hypothetical protein A2U01_0109173, partial [Trifolium medium]|nr:hypothetical protein [Trifolium medium]